MIDKITKISQVTSEVTFFLRNLGFSNYYIIKMFSIYNDSIINLIKDNPYFLLEDFPRIGFKKIDEISKMMGNDDEYEFRIEAGIKYILGWVLSNGNTFSYYDEFVNNVTEFLNVSRELVIDKLSDMAFNSDIQITNVKGRKAVYFYSYYRAENEIAKKLSSLTSRDVKLYKVLGNYEERIEKFEKDNNIKLSDNQKLAVISSIGNPITIITGGPGTGKTTIINCIVDIFEHSGMKVALSAPTGRASKRIMETSKHYAQTVHRLLGYYYDEMLNKMCFSMNEENLLKYNAIIVDEMSMMDLLLMNALTKAIDLGTRLILVGDKDQLPSVGAGSVLKDLIDSEYFNVIKLDNIYRQSLESSIVSNAHKINKGDYPVLEKFENGLSNETDFVIFDKISQVDIQNGIMELSSMFDAKKVQVISPIKKGKVGTIELNEKLHELFNPKSEEKDELPFGSKIFRVGDRVMQIKNNYRIEYRTFLDSKEKGENSLISLFDLERETNDDIRTGQGVFNGEIGEIISIDKEERSLTILYDDEKYVKYEYLDLEEIEHAYAITIHKSQGSEFDIVIIPMTWFPKIMSTRSLIYTGITRAKERVYIVGESKYLNQMVDNDVSDIRDSGLLFRIQNVFNGLE